MPIQSSPAADSRYTLFLKCSFALLAALYLINCLTPIRLCVDTVRYFGIKDCIEFGCPPDSDAAKDYMPYGYTVLLLILSKLGILRSFSIVLINCAYLFTALYLVKKIFGHAINPLLMMVLVLLNWTTIKFVTHPLSEMQYLFFSMSSLYLFYCFSNTRKIGYLLLAFVAGILAFLTRTVGVALFAALLAGLVWEYRKELILILRRNKILIVVLFLLVVGVIVFSRLLGLNHYTGVMSNQFQKGLSRLSIIKWHFTEWGEISMNTSLAKVFRYFPFSSGEAFFILFGLLIFALFIYILFFRKNTIPVIIKVYLLFYSILLFNWPFYDPRFWVPVLPLIAAVAIQTFSHIRHNGIKWAGSLFLAAYITLGIGSIGYMTYTSLHRSTFARSQAGGAYRNEYETQFFGKPQSDTARKIDPFVMQILKRYN
ncbi:MAG TPA: hypothetical protein VNS58_10660 [Puia sp.]|nr:hypothetical protein [Puia sp.]